MKNGRDEPEMRFESMVEQKSQRAEISVEKWPELSLWCQVVMKNGQSWDLKSKVEQWCDSNPKVEQKSQRAERVVIENDQSWDFSPVLSSGVISIPRLSRKVRGLRFESGGGHRAESKIYLFFIQKKFQKKSKKQKKCWILEASKFRVHFKREIRPKRDIVDTSFHASRAFGHNPTLGLGFSYTWEMESVKD